MKRKIYSDTLLLSFRKNFINQLSKFIHGNFLIPENLDQELTMNGLTVTIVGLNDEKQVVLKDNNSKNIYVADAKEIKELINQQTTNQETPNE